MKKTLTFLIISAALAVPMAHAIDETENLKNWEIEPLASDWGISSFASDSVYSMDDERVGRINDILIDKSGKIEAIIVQQRAPLGGWQFYKVVASDVEFDPVQGHTDIELTSDQVMKLDKEDSAYLVAHNNFESSNLLGMPVALKNSDNYGEVVDVMIDPGTKKVTSFVIEAAGKGKSTYAVPANFEAINRDATRLSLDYLKDDVEVVGLFFVPQVKSMDMKNMDMNANSNRNSGNAAERLASFEEIDADDNGQLSKLEIMGYGALDFAAADMDNDGKVSNYEYHATVTADGVTRDEIMPKERMAKERMPKEKAYREFKRAGVFDAWDMDRDGRISEAEFHTGVYKYYDANGDGMVDADEWDDAGDAGLFDI